MKRYFHLIVVFATLLLYSCEGATSPKQAQKEAPPNKSITIPDSLPPLKQVPFERLPPIQPIASGEKPPPPPPPKDTSPDGFDSGKQIDVLYWKDMPLAKTCERSEDVSSMVNCNHSVLKAYLYQEFQYPEGLKPQLLPKQVFLQYTLYKNHRIREVSLSEGLPPEFEKAMLKALHKLDKNIHQLIPFPKASARPYSLRFRHSLSITELRARD